MAKINDYSGMFVLVPLIVLALFFISFKAVNDGFESQRCILINRTLIKNETSLDMFGCNAVTERCYASTYIVYNDTLNCIGKIVETETIMRE